MNNFKEGPRETSRNTHRGRREAPPCISSHKAVVLLTSLLQRKRHTSNQGTRKKLYVINSWGYYKDQLLEKSRGACWPAWRNGFCCEQPGYLLHERESGWPWGKPGQIPVGCCTGGQVDHQKSHKLLTRRVSLFTGPLPAVGCLQVSTLYQPNQNVIHFS